MIHYNLPFVPSVPGCIFRLPHQNHVRTYILPPVYTSYLFHPRFDHRNMTWWWIYILWSSWLCSFLHPPVDRVKPRYLLQHPVVEDAHPVFFPQCKWPHITAVWNNIDVDVHIWVKLYRNLMMEYALLKLSFFRLCSQRIINGVLCFRIRVGIQHGGPFVKSCSQSRVP